MMLAELRESVVWYAQRMVTDRLASARQGNVSALDRREGLFAITPSAVEYMTLKPADIAILDLDGRVVDGHLRPTSEYPMHLLIYQRRPDVAAVIHSHAPMTSVFAATYETLPLVLGETAGAVGHAVKVAPHVAPGTQELGEVCLETMGDGLAVIMGSHGLLVVGHDLASAYSSTHAVEDNARVVIFARTMGAHLHIISDDVAKQMHQEWVNSYRQDEPVGR